MHRNGLFARIGWGDRYVGEDLTGRFSEPNESNSWWERFNFMVGPEGRCYGYVPPMGPHSSPPNPAEKTDFLVVLCSRPDYNEPLRPVGWYENASFGTGHTARPRHPGLKASLRQMWNEMQYSFSASAASTYFIPVENRSSFESVPTANFARPYVYARSEGRDRYPVLLALAERITAMKDHAHCLGKPLNTSMRERVRAAIEDAANALEDEENVTHEEARKRVLTSVLERPNQTRFRDLLMKTYRSRCTISECDCTEVLEAAHILPVAEGGRDLVTNGLVLRADLHRLFDLKKLTVHPTKRTVRIAASLRGTIYEQFDGKAILSPAKSAHSPDAQCLKRHFEGSGL